VVANVKNGLLSKLDQVIVAATDKKALEASENSPVWFILDLGGIPTCLPPEILEQTHPPL